MSMMVVIDLVCDPDVLWGTFFFENSNLKIFECMHIAMISNENSDEPVKKKLRVSNDCK